MEKVITITPRADVEVLQLAGRACRAERVGALVYLGGRERRPDLEQRKRERGLGVGETLEALAGAAGQPAPGGHLGGDVGAERSGELEQQCLIAEPRGQPCQAQSSGRVG